MNNKESNWFSPEVKEEKQKKVVNSSTGTKKLWKPFSKLYLPIKKRFTKLQKAFKSRVLLRRILFTLLILTIFKIASTITIPGVSVHEVNSNENSLVGVLDLISGGGLKNLSIVALGISPYITSSIIMQLLSTEAFPPLYRLSRSGPNGKRKINIITRCLTFCFAYLQAVAISQSFELSSWISLSPKLYSWPFQFLVIPIIMVAGSMFSLFLGEQITNRGIGNGTSLIIFVGIASSIIGKFRNAFQEFVGIQGVQSLFVGSIEFALYLAVFLMLVFIIGFIYKSERHIPIQQTGAGLTSQQHKMSKLPIKINPSGVIPIIFAMSITSLPLTIAQFLDHQNLSRIWIEQNLRLNSAIGLSIFAAITFLFTILMSLVIFNPERVADNFKKNGTFIPGIRPGVQTEEYLTGVIFRLSLFSAFYLCSITSLTYIEQIIGLSPQITFSGASMIILVTVAIETWSQVKARDTTAKISKAKSSTNKKVLGNENQTKGLLW